MRSAARRVLAVARLTFREAWRRRIVLAAVIMSGGFLLLYGLGLHFAGAQLMQSGRMGVDQLMQREAAAQLVYFGLFPVSFIVALTAVFASVGTISSELETGVLYGVLARPVRRAELVLGKFLGLGAMLAVYAAVLNGAVLLMARLMIAAPVESWPVAILLFVLEPLILLALAVLGSTRLPTLATGVLCTAAYGIGFVGGIIEQIGGLISNRTMMDLGIVSSLLIPLDAIHRKGLSSALPNGLLFGNAGSGMGFGESVTPSAWMVAYAAGYLVLVVWLAARVFAKRDL